MSVTFSVCKETLEMRDEKVIVRYTSLYPDDFDNTPRIDPDMPEYGAIPPENPWDLNVSNINCLDLLRTLGLWEEGRDPSDLHGVLDPAKLALACDQALSTLQAVPEIDMGTNSREDEPGQKGCRMVICGHMPGYFTNRFEWLKKLAVIAQERYAVIGYS